MVSRRRVLLTSLLLSGVFSYAGCKTTNRSGGRSLSKSQESKPIQDIDLRMEGFLIEDFSSKILSLRLQELSKPLFIATTSKEENGVTIPQVFDKNGDKVGSAVVTLDPWLTMPDEKLGSSLKDMLLTSIGMHIANQRSVAYTEEWKVTENIFASLSPQSQNEVEDFVAANSSRVLAAVASARVAKNVKPTQPLVASDEGGGGTTSFPVELTNCYCAPGTNGWQPVCMLIQGISSPRTLEYMAWNPADFSKDCSGRKDDTGCFQYFRRSSECTNARRSNGGGSGGWPPGAQGLPSLPPTRNNGGWPPGAVGLPTPQPGGWPPGAVGMPSFQR